MTTTSVARDERTVAIENASYRWAYLVLSYGLLLSIGYRGLIHDQTSWDLFALLFLGGAVATLYQGRHRVLSRRWAIATVVAMAVAAVLALLFVVMAVAATAAREAAGRG